MAQGNGCGPEDFKINWMPRLMLSALNWLLNVLKQCLFNWFYLASCNKHDEGYTKGGDEIRRFLCDWNFKLAMRKDHAQLKRRVIQEIKESKHSFYKLFLFFKAIKIPVSWLFMWVFYFLVRCFGSFKFTYHSGHCGCEYCLASIR